MTNIERFLQNYWSYYLMLEKKFLTTTSYVSLSTRNYNTFSNEYAGLLQLVGSELDVFFKEYCGFQLNDTKTIADYAGHILGSDPDITVQQIEILNCSIIIQPFMNWDASKAKQSLSWWSSFTEVKHNRIGNETKATLENVINILGALFTLETKYMRAISDRDGVSDRPDEMSALFRLKNWKYNYIEHREAFKQFVEMAEKAISEV